MEGQGAWREASREQTERGRWGRTGARKGEGNISTRETLVSWMVRGDGDGQHGGRCTTRGDRPSFTGTVTVTLQSPLSLPLSPRCPPPRPLPQADVTLKAIQKKKCQGERRVRVERDAGLPGPQSSRHRTSQFCIDKAFINFMSSITSERSSLATSKQSAS